MTKNLKYINSYSQLNPISNSSIVYSLGDNSFFSNTERIPIKYKFQNNNFNNINKDFDKNNLVDEFMKNTAVLSNNKKIKFNQKNGKNRRTLSYGNLEIRPKKNDNNINKMLNNNTVNYSNVINNTQSLKALFPSYSITSPNGLIYPIIFTNNNANYINNNNLNNNILYNYQGSIPISTNNLKKMKPKPSLWYANIFSPINQIPIIQDNNIALPKYLNNSANFNSINSIPNINNIYSEDYINKQIYDFINSNAKTKENIISNIGKKHNFKLSKSNGAIKINELKNKNSLNKNLKMKNTNYLTMNTGQLLSDRTNNDKPDKTSKDKIFQKSSKNKTKYKSSLKNKREMNENFDIITNIKDIKTPNKILFNKKNQNLKMNYFSNNNNKNNTNNELNINNTRNIDEIQNNFINLNNNKITNKNFSIEFNKRLEEKQKNYSYTQEKINENLSSNDNYFTNANNVNNISQQEQYLYRGNNFNNNSQIIPSIININKDNENNENNENNNNYDKINTQNSLKMNYNINKKNIPVKNKYNLTKKDKINFNNFNIQNIPKQTLKPKLRNNFHNSNISISTLHSNENKNMIDPVRFKISNAVDEKFINKNNIEKKDEEQNISSDSLRMSLQSMNDSKILELANRFIDEEKVLDKNKINDILNDKNSQKIMKKYV